MNFRALSSNDSDEDISFQERVRRAAHRKKMPKTSLPKRVVHAISDNEESNSPKGNNVGTEDDLPDLDIPAYKSQTTELHFNSIRHVISLSSSEDEGKDYDSEVTVKVKNQTNVFYSKNSSSAPVSNSESNAVNQVSKPKNKKIQDPTKELEKEKRRKLREEKKKERELTKCLKETEKEILKNRKPKECINNMSVVIDHNIIYRSESQELFTCLDQSEIKYSVEENHIKYAVLWFRTIANVSVENGQVIKEEKNELEDTVVLFIPNEEFLRMMHAFIQKSKGIHSDHSSLTEYIVSVKALTPGLNLSCVTVGFSKFMRDLKNGQNENSLKVLAKQVSKNSSEEAITELQLQAFVNFHFLDDMTQFGKLLCCFTKAVAESPMRKEKQQQKALFSWYADADSSCPVKVGIDGTGSIQLWKQQIQQFQNVGPEVAEAIVSLYQSPRHLIKAYKNCSSQKDSENLLQDIVVRRNYGPLGTQKRIGPELSYKIYTFFTSTNGNQILKR